MGSTNDNRCRPPFRRDPMSWPRAFAWGFGVTAAAFVFIAVVVLLEQVLRGLGVGVFAFVLVMGAVTIIAKTSR
jgi:hypothetical protein